MNAEFNEILLGIKRSIGLLSRREKRSLYIATFLMLITGILTNGPAVILGKLVDQLVGGSVIQFDVVVPFILLVCGWHVVKKQPRKLDFKIVRLVRLPLYRKPNCPFFL